MNLLGPTSRVSDTAATDRHVTTRGPEAITPTLAAQKPKAQPSQSHVTRIAAPDKAALEGAPQPRLTPALPGSAFATQILDQLSGENDQGVYLERARAYAQSTPLTQSRRLINFGR